MSEGSLKSYVLGFSLSIILTLAAYFILTCNLFSKSTTDLSIAGVAILQGWLFLYTFLDLGKESKPHWNMTVFLFMLLVTFILVVGTVWIMYNLRYNLTPN